MPLTFLRNRLTYMVESALLPQRAAAAPVCWWDTEGLPLRQACQHPELPGLWIIRGMLTAVDLDRVQQLVGSCTLPPLPERRQGVHAQLSACTIELGWLRRRLAALDGGDASHRHVSEALTAAEEHHASLAGRAAATVPPPAPKRTTTQWEWFAYEPARHTVPMHAQPSLPANLLEQLHDFEVFDKAPPCNWLSLPRLRATCEAADDADARLTAASEGAAVLQQLASEDLPRHLQQATGAAVRCSFLQLQKLVRGAAVTSHLDAATPRADVVATACLSGSSAVGVGHVMLPLAAGDVYALEGHARWRVPHHVCSGYRDRLSVTFRFVDESCWVGDGRVAEGDAA